MNNEIVLIGTKINQLTEAADRAEIKTQEDYEKGVTLQKFLQEAKKRAEEERKALVSPFNNGVKAINDRFKQLTEPLDRAKSVIGSKMLAFVQAERAKEAERAKKLAEESEAPVAPAETQVGKARGSHAGSAHVRKTWNFRVTDESKVPREYLVVSDALIRAAVKAGKREIAGVEIFEEEGVIVR